MGDLSSTLSSEDDAPTRAILVAAAGDACASCEAPLAADQRYCLNCGERRGKSRFAAAVLGSGSPAPATQAPRRPIRRRFSPNATLVTGIATLLLAMGVGVEIGRLGNNGSASPQRAAAPGIQVVTVGGGSAGAATSATHAKKSKGKPAKVKTVIHLSKKVAANASAAAAKVLGSSSNNLAPTTVQPGQSCSHGAGCQGGKFTGNFFGG